MERLILNKNRGWRGLAEAQLLDEYNNTIQKMIFSFSADMWHNMLNGYMVMQDNDNYIILRFVPDKSSLPRPEQQRSVLIKNAILPIVDKRVYPKTSWTDDHKTAGEFKAISDFIKNTNNHTTSDWNCVGIRVTPVI